MKEGTSCLGKRDITSSVKYSHPLLPQHHKDFGWVGKLMHTCEWGETLRSARVHFYSLSPRNARTQLTD